MSVMDISYVGKYEHTHTLILSPSFSLRLTLNIKPFTHLCKFLNGSEMQEANKFGYTGGIGPNKWASLNPNFSLCSHGKAQSPIDIATHKAFLDKTLKPLIRVYHASNATLVDNGFNVGVSL